MPLITFLRPDQRAERARIRTTACRGYVVELDPQGGADPRLLRDLAGDVVHFRSLDRVRTALRRRGVRHARLVQHHACEELGALGTSSRAERGIPMLSAAPARVRVRRRDAGQEVAAT